ncbi:RNA-directed DNA polymerase [Sulfurimonas lithotrophica]|uniref:RNA-directed DNA polymerase n=1 Tax=Sulfurimonas lithotrophica TaxID=2590022 RepID=A0A5P8P176_9BACT|nr:antiviral reverse transcriptase Drt3a [Sulfurimonas lithotrophica]QFR49380.1 RNA-directed DNA polymerase [Sulfurimonas lithotrophica]
MKQSFNVENFTKIYYDENRKGDYLDGRFSEFNILKHYGNSIKKINKKFRDGFYSTVEKRERANHRKERLKKRKFDNLQIILSLVEEKIDKKNYSISMLTKTIKGKTAYTVDRSNVETFFLFKQIQKNIQHSFKVKQADRNEIVSQVVNMLDNGFPKYIIRTDIASFYETIPHDELKKVISRNHILSPLSKKIINEILRQYQIITGQNSGIPRGIGISAYLAELYMRDFDNDIRDLSNVTYYARYVDDIIIVFTPNNKHESIDYLNLIDEKITKYGLRRNTTKTKPMDFTQTNNFNFDFLGYNFTFANPLKIDISSNKEQRYKEKLNISIEDYNRTSKYNEKAARRLLIQRLKYLTGNTRLLGVKKDILIGAYFSNQQISVDSKLKRLDNYFKCVAVERNLQPYSRLNLNGTTKLKNKLKTFSFVDGFQKKNFYKFSKKELEEILSIWKNL